MRAPGIVLLIAFAATAPAPEQRGPAISGRVIHSLTGAPLAGAVVAARRSLPGVSSGTPDIAFLTDASGSFALRDLPAGPVNVTASKTGYLDTHRAAVFTLAPGDRVDDVVIALTPTSLISGRVVDPAGDPVPNAYVRLAEAGSALSSRGARSTSTDDRGVFVVDGLAAGRYAIGAARSVAGSLEIPEAATVIVEVGTGVEQTSTDLGVPFSAGPGRTIIVSGENGSSRSIEAQPGAASIAGTVRNSRGRGLPGIMVIATRASDLDATSGVHIWSAMSDERGEFVIQQLPAGAWVVGAGTARWMFFRGSTRPNQPGPPVQVATGQRTAGVDIALPEPGAISGVVRDEFGDPVSASVRLVVASFPDGFSTLATRPTDDRGRYRFGSLRPGRYLVLAERQAAGPLLTRDAAGIEYAVGYAPTFFAGAPSHALATPLQIERGTELQGIDITADHVPVSRVRLSVHAAGAPLEALAGQRFAVDGVSPVADAGQVQAQSVTFESVAAGRWLIVASANVTTPRGVEKFWASREITTDGRTPAVVEAMLEPGASIAGRIVFDGTTPAPPDAAVWLTPAQPNQMSSSDLRVPMDPSGGFRISGIAPGRYVLHAADKRSGGPWTLSRATMRGEDVLDLPIELGAGSDRLDVVLTLSDRQSALSGTVTDASGRPLPEVEVAVVAADSRYHSPGSRRLRTVVPTYDGRFSLRGLPAGEYILGPVPSPTDRRAPLPVRPEHILPAARATLLDGEQKTVDVRIVR